MWDGLYPSSEVSLSVNVDDGFKWSDRRAPQRKAEVRHRGRKQHRKLLSHRVCMEEKVQVMNFSEGPEVTRHLTSLPQRQSKLGQLLSLFPLTKDGRALRGRWLVPIALSGSQEPVRRCLFMEYTHQEVSAHS